MTTLPDWLVERAALDEVPPASRDRVERADASETAQRVARLREDNERELSSHPAKPAVAQIEERVASAAKQQQKRRMRMLGIASSVAAAAAITVIVVGRTPASTPDAPERPPGSDGSAEYIGVKGPPRLFVYLQAGDHADPLQQDMLVKAGDVIQLRYNAGGRSYGVIASIDGAGAVTLHYPAREDAPTAIAPNTRSVPNAYALDDAPDFERFFFLSSKQPIDLQQSLATLRAFARRADSDTAALELPAGIDATSLRLRKPSPTRKP